METIDRRTFGEKVKDFGRRGKIKFDEFGDWCKNHKEIVIVAIPGLLTLATETVKAVSRSHNRSDKDKLYKKSIYDRRHGNYIIVKKTIKPRQQEEINRRHDAGEEYYDILKDMNIKVER